MKVGELRSIFGAIGIDLDKIIADGIKELEEANMKYYVLYRPEDGLFAYYNLDVESPPQVKRFEWDTDKHSNVTDVVVNIMSCITQGMGKECTGHHFYDVACDLVGAVAGMMCMSCRILMVSWISLKLNC